MDILSSFQVSSSGMNVQQMRMAVATENLANSSATHTPEGGPYQRRVLSVTAKPIDFEYALDSKLEKVAVTKAEVTGIQKSGNPPRMIFDPHHPDANKDGFVATPDINTTQEMVEIMSASKVYEANISAFNATKTMVQKTFDLGA